MIKYALKVLPKPEVLDTQGRAVQGTMQAHGFALQDCHVGKYIVLEINADNEADAQKMAADMAETGLYNPLIETYQLEKL